MQMAVLTTKKAAELLQTSEDTIIRLIQSNELKAERLTPRGRYRIIEQSLIDYATRNGITLRQIPR